MTWLKLIYKSLNVGSLKMPMLLILSSRHPPLERVLRLKLKKHKSFFFFFFLFNDTLKILFFNDLLSVFVIIFYYKNSSDSLTEVDLRSTVHHVDTYTTGISWLLPNMKTFQCFLVQHLKKLHPRWHVLAEV